MKRFSVSFARLPRVVFSIGVASLLGSLAVPARAQVTIHLVPVGNAGNANDPATGNVYGGVGYDYQIGKYDVTIGQYTAFLNAADPTGTNPNGIYNALMGTDLNIAGISYNSDASDGSKYSVIGPFGTVNGQTGANRPATYVSWFDAARFANWMANGQGSGSTENGAYDLATAPADTAPAKNLINPNTGAAPTFYIPNENEFYKAAYYSPNYGGVGVPGYYAYATQSNTAPGNVIGSAANQANYAPGGGGFSVTQSDDYDYNQNYLTDVGAFSGSGSFYGTFDQSGNVYQWNDLDGLASSGSSRGLRGGDWFNIGPFNLSSSGRGTDPPLNKSGFVGFRLAAPVAVPEPSTYAMALAGLAYGGYLVKRRRKRA